MFTLDMVWFIHAFHASRIWHAGPRLPTPALEDSYFYPRISFYVSELKRLDKFLISCDVTP